MSNNLIALDVGEKRIGVAVADKGIKIAVPYDTIEVDGKEINTIAELMVRNKTQTLIVGYPRNQQGEATRQTEYVESFCKPLESFANIIFQDESLTSVEAEKRLAARTKRYSKGDIDAEAAAIILQDYIEEYYG